MASRKLYLDVLRMIATIAVIIIHVAGPVIILSDVNSYNFGVSVFIDSLCRFCVPVFFMISGALFLNANRKIDYKKLYLKNILRLFVCLLVFSFFYNYVYIAFTDHSPNFGDAMTFLSSFGMNTQIEVGGGTCGLSIVL